MQPMQASPSQAPSPQAAPTQSALPEKQGWEGGATANQNSQYVPINYGDRAQLRTERRAINQAAGLPVWGVLLILLGMIALLGNLGVGVGWIFGLALGVWFVYLGIRPAQEGRPVNWWLTGLGLLIGLGAISTGFLDQLVFPLV